MILPRLEKKEASVNFKPLLQWNQEERFWGQDSWNDETEARCVKGRVKFAACEESIDKPSLCA